ncbi:UNVERIFIED_CONTAM: putative zinc ribbon protein [Acetivibrio alkalicellulosi]
MPDKNLICKDCGSEFIFSEGEQTFYKEKGFENEPQRCTTCRQAKKQQKRSNNNYNRDNRTTSNRGYSNRW